MIGKKRRRFAESEVCYDTVGGQDGNARVLKTRGSNP